MAKREKEQKEPDIIDQLLYLAIGNASKKWTMPVRNWSMAMNQFAIIFGEDRVKIV